METPHHGRWFEELPVGLVVPHALTRTITETDNVLFTTMTLNPARLHLDAEYAAGTEFGRPLVNSLFTLGLLVGISVLETTHGTTVANLGFEEVTSGAFSDNPMSLAVSRKVGYRTNGERRFKREGEAATMVQLVLRPEDLVRPHEDVAVEGAEEFVAFVQGRAT